MWVTDVNLNLKEEYAENGLMTQGTWHKCIRREMKGKHKQFQGSHKRKEKRKVQRGKGKKAIGAG